MLGKLAFRNMKRSSRDYLVYILTMTAITAMMYASNSLIFQNELTGYFELEMMMEMMLILATVFIVLIVAWLINYMVRFMLEKRSAEFGIYLLLGMKKKTISKLYMRENFLLGCGAFLPGVVLGFLLQQILQVILFAMTGIDYHFHFSLNKWTILMTILCYAGCYLLALLRCKRKFKKMNIQDLMNAKRRNEEIKEKHEGLKRLLLPVSVLVIIAFWTVFKFLSNATEIFIFLTALVITIYLFYIGLSSWIVCYVRKKGSGIYKSQNLFLLRQFSSKIKTMQFTLGTLTALFTIALLGSSISLMFSDYENTVLKQKFPFDVQIYSSDVGDTFAEELKIIESSAKLLDYHPYHIYTDKDNQANVWMYTHLQAYGTMYQNPDGSPNMAEIEDALENGGNYCTYDTYMGISDYNYLRKMLGYEEISLGKNSYVIHIKSRLAKQTSTIAEDLQIADAEKSGLLSCAGIYPEPFSQDGHNGGDYLLIVPDEVLGRMQPYYSELAADIKGKAPSDLEKKLDTLSDKKDFGGHAAPDLKGNSCSGSDNIITYVATNLVRDNLIPEVKYMLAALIIPMFYIGLVFLCVAVTVLSVQQLSDSAKYKFRYDVLGKIGLERSEINLLILKQLLAHYLCPALLAIVISGKMILYVSDIFVKETGVPTAFGVYFAKSICLFFGIYLVYFVVTFISFKRNVER